MSFDILQFFDKCLYLRIKKQMFIKFRISSSEPKKMNFYQIAIEYILAGHYRGE